MKHIGQENMFQLQLDTVAGIHGFYSDIAVGVLTQAALAEKPERRELRDYIESWDGRAVVIA